MGIDNGGLNLGSAGVNGAIAPSWISQPSGVVQTGAYFQRHNGAELG